MPSGPLSPITSAKCKHPECLRDPFRSLLMQNVNVPNAFETPFAKDMCSNAYVWSGLPCRSFSENISGTEPPCPVRLSDSYSNFFRIPEGFRTCRARKAVPAYDRQDFQRFSKGNPAVSKLETLFRDTTAPSCQVFATPSGRCLQKLGCSALSEDRLKLTICTTCSADGQLRPAPCLVFLPGVGRRVYSIRREVYIYGECNRPYVLRARARYTRP